MADIPEADRKDFIEAYQNGDRKEIGRVLDRGSFRQNMALETSAGVRHKSADAKSKPANDKSMTKNMAASETPPDKEAASSAGPAALANLAADSLNLSGVRLVDASSSGATIPDASGPRQNAR